MKPRGISSNHNLSDGKTKITRIFPLGWGEFGWKTINNHSKKWPPPINKSWSCYLIRSFFLPPRKERKLRPPVTADGSDRELHDKYNTQYNIWKFIEQKKHHVLLGNSGFTDEPRTTKNKGNSGFIRVHLRKAQNLFWLSDLVTNNRKSVNCQIPHCTVCISPLLCTRKKKMSDRTGPICLIIRDGRWADKRKQKQAD